MNKYEDYKAGDTINDGYLHVSAFAHDDFVLIEEDGELIYYVPDIDYNSGREVGKLRRTLKTYLKIEEESKKAYEEIVNKSKRQQTRASVGDLTGLLAGARKWFGDNK